MDELNNGHLLMIDDNALLADNLHWSDEIDTTDIIRGLASDPRLKEYPDVLTTIICYKGSVGLHSANFEVSAGPLDAMILLNTHPIDKLTFSKDSRAIFFAGRLENLGTQIDLDDANYILRHMIHHHDPIVLHLNRNEYKAVEKLYESCRTFLNLSSPDTREWILSGYLRITSALIAEKLHSLEDSPGVPEVRGDRTILAEFIDNVRLNCRKERGISFYASKAHLTPKYFSKVIHSMSGKAPGAIIREFTLADARSLLASKKYSVKEVSSILNFSSPASFGKYFKAAQGCTPGEYLKSTSLRVS